MYKKIQSLIIILNIIFITIPATYAAHINDNIPYCDSGYIVTLCSPSQKDFSDMGVKCISKLANIYYVPNIEAVNAIQAACDIEFIEENKPIDYTLPIIDEHKEDFTLFSEDAAVNKDDTITYRMNDNYYRLQWGYEAVNAYAYYDNNIRGQDVKIGIIDTGLNIQGIGYPNGYQVCNELYIDTPNEATEDLRNLKFEGLNMIAYIKNETDRLKYLCNGSTHGTSVTGIIVASANNNAGIAGMTGLCSVFFIKIRTRFYLSICMEK